MIGVAMLYRYADFITFVGGSEWHLGWVVGVGMIGSLVSRLLLGSWIDRHGPRLVWLGSLGLLAASCFGHLWVTHYNSPFLYVLRIAYCCALAGIFAATMTFISNLAPTVRMAEMIGMLGTSGFIGMMVGSQLGDLLLGTAQIAGWQVHRVFVASGSLGILAMAFTAIATGGLPRPQLGWNPPLLWLVRRYFPGWILLVGVSMGIAMSLPSIFLRPLAAELGIPRIGLFFGAYAPSAILTRLLTRRWPEWFGLTPMVLVGLSAAVVSQLLLLCVSREWMLVIPGVSYGISHALFFPSTVAAGAQFFPKEHRGLGTTLMLAAFDVGVLVGSPLAGTLIHLARWLHWPSYPTMILVISMLETAIGVVYGVSLLWRSPVRDDRLATEHGREVGKLGKPSDTPIRDTGREAAVRESL